MRVGLLLLPPLAAVAWLAGWPAAAEARPEFARREGKACGVCHINPRGGGARNETGLAYARNGFKFPEKSGDLSDFKPGRERDAMARARKLLDLQHIPKAVQQLRSLASSVRAPAAKKLVEDQLHLLDVKGAETLGQARRLLRGKEAQAAEGLELLVLVASDYKGLSAATEAAKDLKELKADKARAPLVASEERESKARLAFLDALLLEADGLQEKAVAAFRKVAEEHPGTRAAKAARAKLG